MKIFLILVAAFLCFARGESYKIEPMRLFPWKYVPSTVWLFLLAVYVLFIRGSIPAEVRADVTFYYFIGSLIFELIAEFIFSLYCFKREKTVYWRPLFPLKHAEPVSYVLFDKDGYLSYVAACLVRDKGFLYAKMIKESGEYGTYILGRKKRKEWCVQCINTDETVPPRAVEELLSSLDYYKAKRAMLVTNGVLTDEAKRLAEQNQVEVWENYGKKDEISK